jgi:hypothetical protein
VRPTQLTGSQGKIHRSKHEVFRHTRSSHRRLGSPLADHGACQAGKDNDAKQGAIPRAEDAERTVDLRSTPPSCALRCALTTVRLEDPGHRAARSTTAGRRFDPCPTCRVNAELMGRYGLQPQQSVRALTSADLAIKPPGTLLQIPECGPPGLGLSARTTSLCHQHPVNRSQAALPWIRRTSPGGASPHVSSGPVSSTIVT